VRHGHGCHNAVSTLYKNNILKQEDALQFHGNITNDAAKNDKLFIDPELTQIGLDASAYNGCIISKTIRKIGFDQYKKDVFSTINLVGCSPLIRCMETAYEMTKNWSVKPDKIYVFPYLREIDESSIDKHSKESQFVMDTTPSYAMKTIDEQTNYLKSVNLNKIIDFSFVKDNMKGRSEAGDIPRFIEWFINTILPNIEPVKRLNVFIVTHTGVLSDFVRFNISNDEGKNGFINNDGFIITIDEKNTNQYELTKYIPLRKHLPKTFFRSYSDDKYTDSAYYCPSNRCSKFCNYIPHDKSKQIDKIDVPKCSNSKNENLSTTITKLKK
jgi:broad specificity phosphatase PhoE